MKFLRSRWRALAIGISLVCSFWLTTAAQALPVGDYNVANVDNQTTFTSGLLSFSNFQFWLDGDPGDFTLSVLDDGIRLLGPMSVADGAVAEFFFSYEVSVLGNAQGIGEVSLFAPSEITGGGFPTFVKTAKLIFSGPSPEFWPNDTLVTLNTANFAGSYSELASTSFAPQPVITVLDGVRLSTGGSGDTATLESITNRFAVVPEPTSLALLGLGVLGLGISARRR